MFRVVVIVGIAMAPVIILALVVDPLAGAILFGIEIGVAIGLLVQRSRGAEPRTAEVASSDDSVHRVLVVANQTVGGRALLDEIRRRVSGEQRSEILVVTPPLAGSAAEHWSSDIDQGIKEARERLDASIATMRQAGLEVRGQMGDHHDPNQAIEDALREFAADEVIISTHTPERSRWLESGVVEKARSELPQPVTHVVVDLEAEAGKPAA
jgi:GABA permease